MYRYQMILFGVALGLGGCDEAVLNELILTYLD